MTDHLPQYVEYGANPRYQPPFSIHGCRMYNFVLESDYSCQQALLDKCLNTPSGGAMDFRAVGRPGMSYVLLSFADLQHQSAREANLGWVVEREVDLWILGWETRKPFLSWFLPYIFVDSDAALITGRQDYGFPKRLGWFTFPSPNDPTTFSMETTVIPTYEPTTQAVRKPLIDIRQISAATSSTTYTTLEHLCSDVAHLLFDGHALSVERAQSARMTQTQGQPSGGIGALIRREISTLDNRIAQVGETLERDVIDIGKALGLGNIPLVFLKQFRDATYADRACYQGIIGTFFRVTNFVSARLLGDYEITLSDYPSAPIRQDLGLASGLLKPKLSFVLEFDFIAEPGAELWKAG